MQLFVAEEGFKRVFTRKALGFKEFRIADDVKIGVPVVITDRGTLEVDPNPTGEEKYTILCKRIGLFNYLTNDSNISTVFLDEEYMLVTLHYGAIVIDVTGTEIMPTVGVEPCKVVLDTIHWVDVPYMKTFYAGTRNEGTLKFTTLPEIYDFELFSTISGGNPDRLARTCVRGCKIPDDQRDISGGAYAEFVRQENARAELKKAKQIMNNVYLKPKEDKLEFDEDDELTEEYEEL